MKKAFLFLIMSTLLFSFSLSVFAAQDTFTGEYTNYEVSSTNFNNKIFYAWTGTGASPKVNIALLHSSKVTLNEESLAGPTLYTFKNKVFLAWTGTNGQLNIMSSNNGLNFSNKVTLSDTSLRSVSLTSNNDTLFMCWAGTNNKINVIQSKDGITWTNKVTLNETSRYTPMIQSFYRYGFNSYSYNIAWVSTAQNNVDFITSSDGISWNNKVTTSGFNTKCSSKYNNSGGYYYVDSNDNTYYFKSYFEKISQGIITDKLPSVSIISFAIGLMDINHTYTFYKGLDSKIYYKYEYSEVAILT